MDWRWTARRLGISLFLFVHLGATTIWVLPECPLRRATIGVAAPYMLPLGLWQFWTMFAPDPVRDTLALEADVVDSRGLRYRFAFPRLAGYSTWEGIPRFRYSKYAANIAVGEFEKPREFAARHAIRQLNVPAEAFPVEVHLIYEIKVTPPLGQGPEAVASAPRYQTIDSFQFASLSEVRP
jgi:hypothetical protein